MKVTNFSNYTDNETYCTATVDVTTGIFFKKTTTVEVFKQKISKYWRFKADGNLTPGYKVEDLYESYKAYQ